MTVSKAQRIRLLYRRGWQACEIMARVGCSKHYLDAVVSRLKSPNEETRRRRSCNARSIQLYRDKQRELI